MGTVDLLASHCVSLAVRAHGQDGGRRLLFRFRSQSQSRQEGTVFPSDLITVRVDVPCQYAAQAARFAERLAADHGIKELVENAAEQLPLRRVTCDSQEWIAAPAAAPSEELYAAVLERIDSSSES
ncbi:hypothetical protein [Streptomyces sp. NPDC048442]|uniref:hypothetical protein n=1 Tax=Streptomyces sp. NPDC048442 TaxID=3154823 RepID=UPI003425745D